MHLTVYNFKISENSTRFDFTSNGPNGLIRKVVFFTPTHILNLYNLSLCDIDANNLIKDNSISNNQDTEKVLATVAECVKLFLDLHPEALIYATGNSPSITRLYRMGLNKYFTEINELFDVFGQKSNDWHYFEKNTDYEAFVVQLKN